MIAHKKINERDIDRIKLIEKIIDDQRYSISIALCDEIFLLNLTDKDVFSIPYNESFPIIIVDKNLASDSLFLEYFPNLLLMNNDANSHKNLNEKIKIDENDDINNLSVDKLWNYINNNINIQNIDTPKQKKCDNCGSKNTLIMDQSTNSMICSECGMINDELLDHSPEWRQYNNEDSRTESVTRCGCPSNFFFPKSSQGTIMTGINNNRMNRKQIWNSTTYRERSLNIVFEFISRVCSRNSIPKIIIDTARILYNNLSECKHKIGKNKGKNIIIRGDNRISIIASCVYKACEINKNPRSVKEISEYFEIDDKKITKGIKHFDKIMKNSDEYNIVTNYISSNVSEDYIKRHTAKLNLSISEANMAITIATNCCRIKLASDHNPQSIAACSIYLMSLIFKKSLDKKSIAKVFRTSEVTIGKIYNKFFPYAEALINDELTTYLIDTFKING